MSEMNVNLRSSIKTIQPKTTRMAREVQNSKSDVELGKLIDQGFEEMKNQIFDNSMFNESISNNIESFDLLGLEDQKNPSIEAQETFTQNYDASGDVIAQLFQDLYIDNPEKNPSIGGDAELAQMLQELDSPKTDSSIGGDVELDQMLQELDSPKTAPSIGEDVELDQMTQKLDSPETDPNIGKAYSQAEKDIAVIENEASELLKGAIDNGNANLNGVKKLNGHSVSSIDVNMDMAPIHQDGGYFRSKYSIDGYPARITLDDGSKVDVIFKQDDRTGKYELHKLKAFGGKKDADEIFDYSPTRQAAKNQVKSESLEAAIDKQKAKMGNVMDRLTTTNQARPTRKAQTNTQIDANVISKAEARAAERKQARVKKQQEKELKAEERKQARVKKQQERELKAEERKQERVKKQQEKKLKAEERKQAIKAREIPLSEQTDTERVYTITRGLLDTAKSIKTKGQAQKFINEILIPNMESHNIFARNSRILKEKLEEKFKLNQ